MKVCVLLDTRTGGFDVRLDETLASVKDGLGPKETAEELDFKDFLKRLEAGHTSGTIKAQLAAAAVKSLADSESLLYAIREAPRFFAANARALVAGHVAQMGTTFLSELGSLGLELGWGDQAKTILNHIVAEIHNLNGLLRAPPKVDGNG